MKGYEYPVIGHIVGLESKINICQRLLNNNFCHFIIALYYIENEF